MVDAVVIMAGAELEMITVCRVGDAARNMVLVVRHSGRSCSFNMRSELCRAGEDLHCTHDL